MKRYLSQLSFLKLLMQRADPGKLRVMNAEYPNKKGTITVRCE